MLINSQQRHQRLTVQTIQRTIENIDIKWPNRVSCIERMPLEMLFELKTKQK